MSHNTPPSEATKSTENDEANEEVHDEAVTYDAMANMVDNQKDVIIKRNEDLIREEAEKEEKEAKEIEQEGAKAMEMKNPDFSLGWTIGDTRCYMVTLQVLVAASCAFLLLLSSSQTTLECDIKCGEEENKYKRPYLGETGNGIEGCPWPATNVIIRVIGPGFGLLFAVITIILSYWRGSAILKDMKDNNDGREKVKKLEYFDIYNQFAMFKIMRFVLGICGYLQFISAGFDAFSFLVGDEFMSSELNGTNERFQFELVIAVSLAVAVLFRVSHDSMYQRVYKHKLKFKLNLQSDKGYAGATVVDKENKVPVIEMGDTHHLAPTQHDLAISVHAQQRQYLENQNRILAASSGVPSVYSDIAPSVYSQTQLNHINTQTMHSLTQQNLQLQEQLHRQNMSVPTVPSQSQSQSQY